MLNNIGVENHLKRGFLEIKFGRSLTADTAVSISQIVSGRRKDFFVDEV